MNENKRTRHVPLYSQALYCLSYTNSSAVEFSLQS